MRFDLHNHTCYSDGVDTIASLVTRAKQNQIDYLAITDHDSVLGVEKIDSKYEKNIIKGIELSTYHKESIHLVGLIKNNLITPELLAFSHDFLEKRRIRAIKMVSLLKSEYNLNVDIERLIANANIRAVTRGNMNRMLKELNPNLTREEIKFYLSKESKAYIPTTKISVADGIDFLHKNNCLVILAHPVLYKQENLKDIIGLPFDGIEAIYPGSKIEDYLYFKSVAKKYNYLISAGSDCHGDTSHADVGTCYLEEEEFRPIAKAIGFKY